MKRPGFNFPPAAITNGWCRRSCFGGPPLSVLKAGVAVMVSFWWLTGTGWSAGLTVRGGQLLRDGQPCRAIGANYYSLFTRLLASPTNTSGLNQLRPLHDAGIPFVRFSAGGYWPRDWSLYQTNPAAHFARLDQVVQAAEAAGMGLIPSLFWHVGTIPDLAGEPVDQLGNPASRSVALIRQYTREVVTRYRASPAIWAWEFGNEYNLAVDLPNAAEHRPPVVPALGTPRERTARDELLSSHLVSVLAGFARTVRELDPDRALLSGHAAPRESAWHNTRERSWKRDTAEQFAEVLRRDHPAPLDLLSVHLYPQSNRRYPGGTTNIDGFLALAMATAREAGRPLVVGEFGAGDHAGQLEEAAAFRELLTAIVARDVPLAAIWVFDFPEQDRDNLNVTFTNARAPWLAEIGRINRARGAIQPRPAGPRAR